MDQKEIDEIVKCISEPRLSKYKKEGELEEYVEIILKNQKIYPALHIMEVIFRNKVHAAVGEILQTKNWLLEYNNGNPSLIKKFSSLKKSKQHKSWWELILFKKSSSEKNDIYEIFNKEITIAFNNSLQSVKNKKREIIEGDLIASLTFGFWTTLISKPFANILGDKGLFIKTFSEVNFSNIGNIGTKEYYKKESEIRLSITSIRANRNRVSIMKSLKIMKKRRN